MAVFFGAARYGRAAMGGGLAVAAACGLNLPAGAGISAGAEMARGGGVGGAECSGVAFALEWGSACSLAGLAAGADVRACAGTAADVASRAALTGWPGGSVPSFRSGMPCTAIGLVAVGRGAGAVGSELKPGAGTALCVSASLRLPVRTGMMAKGPGGRA